ncbi:unnamed protein product [Vitrella brassicaformis CCMP3155]|uniref:Uncharacterized protein n=1 Tax=Vitrella brassicaformis (strain CCMP3155) TaxID=1169540 RepID=A0A0G4EPF8_VITBC|nr:unnamed protein product [Vitrella brassicaformis CCMP3155]|eukprot:CEL99319.1 unnamed protein product [Vitrella brassicaformis CCMP3155]
MGARRVELANTSMRATRNGLFRFQSRNRVPLVISDNNISESTFIAPPSMTVQCKPGEQLVMQGDPYSLKMLVRCKTCKPPSYSLRAGTLHGGPTMPYTFTEGIEGEHPCVAHCPNGVDCDQGWGDVFSRPELWAVKRHRVLRCKRENCNDYNSQLCHDPSLYHTKRWRQYLEERKMGLAPPMIATSEQQGGKKSEAIVTYGHSGELRPCGGLIEAGHASPCPGDTSGPLCAACNGHSRFRLSLGGFECSRECARELTASDWLKWMAIPLFCLVFDASILLGGGQGYGLWKSLLYYENILAILDVSSLTESGMQALAFFSLFCWTTTH